MYSIWYHGQVGGFQGKEIENNEDMEKFYKPWSGSPQCQRFFGDLSFSKGFFQVKLDLWAASRGAAGCSRAQKRCHFMSNLFLECLELWLRRHIPSSESVSAKSPEVAAPRSQNQETTFGQERPFPGGSFGCRFRINSRWTIISDHFSITFYILLYNFIYSYIFLPCLLVENNSFSSVVERHQNRSFVRRSLARPSRGSVARWAQNGASKITAFRRYNNWYPLVMTNSLLLIHGHWNSGFSHWKWWLWLTVCYWYMAIEIVDFPIENGGYD